MNQRGPWMPPTRPKYRVGAKALRTRQTPFGEVVFDSKKEACRWDQLALAQRAGEALLVLIQNPVFRLPGGTRYTADFQVFWRDGSVTFEDVKGHRTQAFIRAKKQVEDLYDIRITEI